MFENNTPREGKPLMREKEESSEQEEILKADLVGEHSQDSDFGFRRFERCVLRACCLMKSVR